MSRSANRGSYHPNITGFSYPSFGRVMQARYGAAPVDRPELRPDYAKAHDLVCPALYDEKLACTCKGKK